MATQPVLSAKQSKQSLADKMGLAAHEIAIVQSDGKAKILSWKMQTVRPNTRNGNTTRAALAAARGETVKSTESVTKLILSTDSTVPANKTQSREIALQLAAEPVAIVGQLVGNVAKIQGRDSMTVNTVAQGWKLQLTMVVMDSGDYAVGINNYAIGIKPIAPAAQSAAAPIRETEADIDDVKNALAALDNDE